MVSEGEWKEMTRSEGKITTSGGMVKEGEGNNSEEWKKSAREGLKEGEGDGLEGRSR